MIKRYDHVVGRGIISSEQGQYVKYSDFQEVVEANSNCISLTLHESRTNCIMQAVNPIVDMLLEIKNGKKFTAEEIDSAVLKYSGCL